MARRDCGSKVKTRAEEVGRWVAALHERASHLEKHPENVADIVTLRQGWNVQEQRTRVHLSYAARVGEDVSQFYGRDKKQSYRPVAHLRAEQDEAVAAGKTSLAHHLGHQIKLINERRALARACNRESRMPFLVIAGPAHRGLCKVCGKRLEGVQVWRDPCSSQVWCPSHGQKA